MTDKNEPGTGSSPADDWADALAEQSRANPPTGRRPEAAGTAGRLGRRHGRTDRRGARRRCRPGAGAGASPAPAQPAAQPAAQSVFKPLSGTTTGAGTDIDLIMDVPVQLTVELGRTRLTIKNLLQLGQGSVVELDGLAGEPMDIFVNGYLIAQGEVVVVEDKYGIRLTDIITPSERINRLNNRR